MPMRMPSRAFGSCGTDASRCVSSDSVRNPWAIGTPQGDIWADSSGSTWMNWRSSVTSAKALMRSWSTRNHSPAPSAVPTLLDRTAKAFSPLLMPQNVVSLPMPLADDLALAQRLADAADAITLARFRAQDLHVTSKPDLSPVSDADLAVEAEVRRLLAEARPGDAVLGEEEGVT